MPTGKGAGGEREPYLPGSASRGLRAGFTAAALGTGRCGETGLGAEGSKPASAQILPGLGLVTPWDAPEPLVQHAAGCDDTPTLDAAPGKVTLPSPLSLLALQGGCSLTFWLA